jgi:hypothetical protein
VNATDTVMCDGCSFYTPDPTWCDHGRVLCPECVVFVPCHHCVSEARDA